MKNHQKVSDFHFRTAPNHGKEALWPRTQQFVDFGAKIVRIVPKSARMNAFWCKSLPYRLENRVQKVCKNMKSANFAENHRWGP